MVLQSFLLHNRYHRFGTRAFVGFAPRDAEGREDIALCFDAGDGAAATQGGQGVFVQSEAAAQRVRTDSDVEGVGAGEIEDRERELRGRSDKKIEAARRPRWSEGGDGHTLVVALGEDFAYVAGGLEGGDIGR